MFRFVGDSAAIVERLADLPLNPLISPETGRRLSIPDVAQNTLLYFPFGILGFWAGAGARLTLRRVAVVTGYALALSVIVEALQLCTVDRVASVADVLTNTVGAGLGAVAAWR
jgi:VanZ family protein